LDGVQKTKKKMEEIENKKVKQLVYKKSIDAKHQRATPKEFDPGLHLNT
jgi:hypothetical protein